MRSSIGCGFISGRKRTQLTGTIIVTKCNYKEAGLKRLTPHDLRRTFATKLLENGEDVFLVQDLMGHSSVETTKNYDRRDEKAKTKAAKALPF